MGATEISESTKRRFRRKLENDFGDLLQVEDLPNNSKVFVLSKKFSNAQLAREIVTLSQQFDNRVDSGALLATLLGETLYTG